MRIFDRCPWKLGKADADVDLAFCHGFVAVSGRIEVADFGSDGGPMRLQKMDHLVRPFSHCKTLLTRSLISNETFSFVSLVVRMRKCRSRYPRVVSSSQYASARR